MSCGGAKAGHLGPWAVGVRSRGPRTTHKYRGMLRRGKRSTGKVAVEDETRKEETSDVTTCTEHLGDGVGDVVDLVDAGDNMLVMVEVTISLLPLAVTYGAHCW